MTTTQIMVQRAHKLLEECFHKLYPRHQHLSAGAQRIRNELRQDDLEAELFLILPKLAKFQDQPIDMVLHCPACHTQHVDRPITDHEYTAQLYESGWELSGDKPERWTNPPHKSHLCHNCGYIWRPADVPTNGVLFVQTKGSADSPLPKQQQADPGTIAPNADKGLLRKALGLKP